VTTTAAPGGWVARLVAQAARNAADDLDHSGHRLWRKAGWTATVPAGDRLVLTGPDASTVTYLIPGVHLPTALHLPVHPDQASTDEHPTVPGVHLYAPHGAARDVFTTAQDEVLLSGPAGTGKSRAALELLNLLALAWPGMRGLVIRKTLTSLGSTALVTWREKVIPEALEAGLVHFYGGSQQEAAAYRYANGSAINLGGMDKSTRVMSSDYDVVYVQEAIELTTDNWEALTTRLRNARTPVQQLLADTNPDKPTHWLNVRCQRGDTRMLHCRHSDNPTLIAPATGKPTLAGAAYLAKLAKLTGVRKARLEGGKWVAAEGIIYDGYDPAIHLVDRFEIPADWTRWIVVDFGFTNPFTAQWYAEDGDGRLWMYREIYHTRRLVEDHARTMLAQMRDGDGVWLEPRPTAVICDHDAEDRATLERHLGMSTSAAHKTVKDGIQAMQARLRPAGDGKPRLYILRDSLVELDPELEEAKKPTCFAEELPGYVWDPAGATAAVPRETKETPLKVDDHGCLIAGTLVATTAGDVPIEQIRPWHLVLTRAGPRPVVASGMTMPAAEVVQVLLSTGEVLVGTGDHPVWVNERGWSRLDSLGYGDRLMGCPTSSELSSPESHSAATQTLHIRPTATTSLLESPTGSGESGTFTRRYGRPSMDRYPRVARSITSTSTPSTMTRGTWPASRSPSTRKFTGNRRGSDRKVPRLARISSGFVRSLRHGTARLRVWTGTAGTLRWNASGMDPCEPAPASSAGPTSRPPTSTVVSGSARIGARRHGVTRAAWTTSRGPAPSAVPSSLPTATAARNAADVHVLSVCVQPGLVPVFNLTVADQPEYFAAGVLVHNCDCARYMCAERDLGARPRVRFI